MKALRPDRTLPTAIASGRFILLLPALLMCIPCVPVAAQGAPTTQGPADENLTVDQSDSDPAAIPPETSVSVTARIPGGENEFPAGEPFEVLVELRVEGVGGVVRLRGFPELELSPNLEREYTASGNRSVPERDGVTKIHFIRYVLRGNAPGEGSVEPKDIEYLLPGDEEPRSLPVPAVTVFIGPPPDEGPALWKILLVTVGIPATVLAVAGAILIARKGRSARETGPGIEDEPAWKRELDEARRKRFEGDPRAYLRDLYNVLRRGAAERCGVDGNLGSGALKAKIEENTAEGSNLREAVRLLEELDTARYAPETPPLEDLDRSAKRIEELLESDRDTSR